MFDRISSIVFVVQNLSVFFLIFTSHLTIGKINMYQTIFYTVCHLDQTADCANFSEGKLSSILKQFLFYLFWRERFILTIDCLCLATRERNHSLGRFRGKKYQKFSELQKICKYISNQLSFCAISISQGSTPSWKTQGEK